MQDDPYCRLCRHRHALNTAHVFGGEPDKPDPVLPSGRKEVVPTVLVGVPGTPHPGRQSNPAWRDERGYFDRNAYQRLYMRGWRKRQKQVKNDG